MRHNTRRKTSPGARRIIAVITTLLCAGAGPLATAGGLPEGRLVDMSYPYNEDTIYWPTEKGFEKTTGFEGMTDKGYYYTAYSIKTAEHGGTHLDAPIHFAEGQPAADVLPLERLITHRLPAQRYAEGVELTRSRRPQVRHCTAKG